MHSKMTQTRCLAIAAWRFTTELLQDWIPRYVKPILTPLSYIIETSGYDGEKPLLHCGCFRSFQNERDRGLWREFSLGVLQLQLPQTKDCNVCRLNIIFPRKTIAILCENNSYFYWFPAKDPIWPSYREICLQYILLSDRQLISPNRVLSLPSQS